METDNGRGGGQRAGKQDKGGERGRDRPADEGGEAFNEARALQQVIERVPDLDEQLRRPGQKRYGPGVRAAEGAGS